jgi:Ni,Fe-hydrogenase III large subunit
VRLANLLHWHDPRGFVRTVAKKSGEGARFCGVFASPVAEGTRLVAVLSNAGSFVAEATLVPEGTEGFPALTATVPAAAWYEREIKDLFGLEPFGHPRTDPLVLPLLPGAVPPRPGSGVPLPPVEIDTSPLPAHVQGEGVFTLSYGPVRSGVFESVEYLVETPGERIPHLRARIFYKHRGMEARFCGLSLADGALLAERYEGVASVAHAIAYCSALESIAGEEIPPAAALVRVLHAELERVANHLESVLRHTEGAGQAVAAARFANHKERLQRLRADLCGNRFGRGVVVPGGVSGPPGTAGPPGDAVMRSLDRLEEGIRKDLELLTATPSFVDRLRGTGVVLAELARGGAAVGPLGRGSGQPEDVRSSRPYGAYSRLGRLEVQGRVAGDALARQYVREDEIFDAFHLCRQALDALEGLGTWPAGGWSVGLGPVTGEALGWAEAPQGELLYLVSAKDGRLVRVKPRSASFHNLALFMVAFPKDILTDFAFIEASFGLSMAGVAG